MNRREFLFGLMAIPFGWKALFKKEEWIVQVDEVDDCPACEWDGWTVSPNDLAPFNGDLSKMIRTGYEDDENEDVETFHIDDDPGCMASINDLPEGPALEMDGIRVGGQDVVTGPISNLADWGKESSFVCINVDEDEWWYGLDVPPYPVGYSFGGAEIISIDDGKCTLGPLPLWVGYEDGHCAKCEDILAPDPIWHELPSVEWELVA